MGHVSPLSAPVVEVVLLTRRPSSYLYSPTFTSAGLCSIVWLRRTCLSGDGALTSTCALDVRVCVSPRAAGASCKPLLARWYSCAALSSRALVFDFVFILPLGLDFLHCCAYGRLVSHLEHHDLVTVPGVQAETISPFREQIPQQCQQINRHDPSDNGQRPTAATLTNMACIKCIVCITAHTLPPPCPRV